MKKLFFLIFGLFWSGCTAQIPTLDQIILRPNTTIETTPLDYGYDYMELTVPVGESREIVIWDIRVPDAKGTVVVFPGSDANKGRYCEALPLLADHGYNVILMDYEGFGNSPGTPSLVNTLDDTHAVAEYAIANTDRPFLFGASLGTPLAMKAASEFSFEGCLFEGTLILEDEAMLWLTDNGFSFPPLWDVANLYIRPQVPEGYDILRYAPLVTERKLFLQSVEDEVTPIEGARRVFDLCPEPKEFWEMIGGHGQMIRLETGLYTNKVIGFLGQ